MNPLADLFPLAPHQRPENRRRVHEPVAQPACELPRSEAFFEDLDPAPALQAVPGWPALRLAA